MLFNFRNCHLTLLTPRIDIFKTSIAYSGNNQRTLISMGQPASNSQGVSLPQFLQAKICVHVLKQLHRMDCDRELLGRERDRKRDREVFEWLAWPLALQWLVIPSFYTHSVPSSPDLLTACASEAFSSALFSNVSNSSLYEFFRCSSGLSVGCMLIHIYITEWCLHVYTLCI